MKLISAPSGMVTYHGIALIVPSDTAYIATDKNGEIHAYRRACRPLPKPHPRVTTWGSGLGMTFVGRAYLEGMDWKDTLMTLNTEDF